MSLHVLSVAYPFAPVGPHAVGGAEQILTTLEAQLVARGICSLVVACEGSEPSGKLFPTALPDGLITAETREQVTRAHQQALDRALAGRVDLVHMHGIDFHEYRIPAHVPVLVTLHVPPSWYPKEIWSLPPHYQLQCVSESQRMSCPANVRERLAVVANGVAIPTSAPAPAKRNFALLLSRICPEKNLHAALAAARGAGIPALLAGQTFPYPEHKRYFEQAIRPLLGSRARLLGPVTGERKQRLLASARCLLLPSLAPETSSLTAMEAIASGTAVIAYRSGALPSILEEGRTGFLVNSVEEMTEAIHRVDAIHPAVCREVAAERFPLSRMADGYMELYSRLLGSSRAA